MVKPPKIVPGDKMHNQLNMFMFYIVKLAKRVEPLKFNKLS